MYSGEKTITKTKNPTVVKTIMFEFVIPFAEPFG